jgi:O-antigen/teichoic acid export membrane protein
LRFDRSWGLVTDICEAGVVRISIEATVREVRSPSVSVKANVVANYISQAYIALLGFVFVPVFIKYLGIEAFGLVAIFTILQSSLAVLDMGMKPALGREMAKFTARGHDPQSIRDLLRSVEVAACAIATSVFLGTLLAAGWIASKWLNVESLSASTVKHAIVGMGALCALRFVENIYSSSIAGLQRQVLQSVLVSSMVTVRALGAIAVLAWVSPTVEGFFIWQVLISAITVPVLAAVVYRQLPTAPRPARFSWHSLTGIWRFAGGVMTITLMSVLLTQTDKLLLSRLLPLNVFAIYAVAGVVSSALYMLSSPIGTAFYPSFAQLITLRDVVALRLAYHQASQLSAVVMGSAAIVLIIFADTVLSAWTGNPTLTRDAAPILRVLAFGTLLSGFIGIPYQMQLAHGWTKLIVKMNVFAVAVLAPMLILIVPRYGGIGAAWVWVVLNAGYLLIGIHLMHMRFLPSEKWRWYGRDVIAPAAAATATALACRYGMPTRASTLIEILFLLFTSTCVVIAAVLVSPLVRVPVGEHMHAAVKHLRFRLRFLRSSRS